MRIDIDMPSECNRENWITSRNQRMALTGDVAGGAHAYRAAYAKWVCLDTLMPTSIIFTWLLKEMLPWHSVLFIERELGEAKVYGHSVSRGSEPPLAKAQPSKSICPPKQAKMLFVPPSSWNQNKKFSSSKESQCTESADVMRKFSKNVSIIFPKSSLWSF